MTLASAIVTHHSARLDDLERLARLDSAALLEAATGLPGVREAAVLATCNRVEVHAAADDGPRAAAGLAALLRGLLGSGVPQNVVHALHGEATARHLFRVASGLDSMVVGESQILGQVKDAAGLARSRGTVGPELGPVLEQAVAVGKRVRTETDIGKGAVSVGTVAVRLAEGSLGGLEDRRVVLVGTGEMATLVARALRGEGCRVTVVTRRSGRSEAVARKVDGQVVEHDALPGAAAEADVLVYATGAPHTILDADLLRSWRRGGTGRPLLVLDLANPRNVDPRVGSLPGVRLADLDNLRSVTDEHHEDRRRAAHAAEALVEDAVDAWRRRRAEGGADGLLRALHLHARAIRDEEVARAIQRLNGSPASNQEVVEALADSLVNKLLARPTAALKAAASASDATALETARYILGVTRDVPPDEAAPAP